MRITVAINYVAGNQPAVRGAVFRVANVITFVTAICSTRADDPMGLTAGAGRRGTATAAMVARAGAFRVRAIEIRAGRTATMTNPPAVALGVTSSIGNPTLTRRARAPVAPHKTIVALTWTWVAARRIVAIADPPKMSIDGNSDGITACIRNRGCTERGPFVNPDSIGIGNLPGCVADAYGISATAFGDAAESGLSFAWLENQAGTADGNDSSGQPSNKAAARNGSG